MVNKTRKPLDQHKWALLLLFISAILWSTGGFLIKQTTWSPMAVVGVRSFIACLLILAVVKKIKFKKNIYFIGALLGYAGTGVFFVSSTMLTTAANAILLQYVAPVYVAFLAIFLLREKLKWFDLAAMLLVVTGIAFFFINEISDAQMIGNLIGIATGVSFAVFIVCSKKNSDIQPVHAVFWGNLFTVIIALPFIRGGVTDFNGFIPVLIMGLFQLGLSYILYAYAIQRVSSMQAAVIPSIEPVLNPIFVFFIIGEAPSLPAVIGGIFILGAVTFHSISSYQYTSKRVRTRVSIAKAP